MSEPTADIAKGVTGNNFPRATLLEIELRIRERRGVP